PHPALSTLSLHDALPISGATMTAGAIASRRGFLRTACRHCIGLAALADLPALAQGLKGDLLPPRFARPAKDTDEGGLWGLMDREDRKSTRLNSSHVKISY